VNFSRIADIEAWKLALRRRELVVVPCFVILVSNSLFLRV